MYKYTEPYNITIETEASYAGRTDIYTVESCEDKFTITHEIGGFMHKKEKTATKKLSAAEFKPIEDAFNKLDFTKVFIESGDNFGCDGWTLKCTIGKVISNISVLLWCPSSHQDIPETTKLLKACDMIFNLFPGEYRGC